MEPTKIQGNPQHATINATPAVGITTLTTLPKMADSPKITTWSLQEIKQFLVPNASDISNVTGTLLCIPQDTIDIVSGKRG